MFSAPAAIITIQTVRTLLMSTTAAHAIRCWSPNNPPALSCQTDDRQVRWGETLAESFTPRAFFPATISTWNTKNKRRHLSSSSARNCSRKESFGRGAVKPCGECEGDALALSSQGKPAKITLRRQKSHTRKNNSASYAGWRHLITHSWTGFVIIASGKTKMMKRDN